MIATATATIALGLPYGEYHWSVYREYERLTCTDFSPFNVTFVNIF